MCVVCELLCANTTDAASAIPNPIENNCLNGLLNVHLPTPSPLHPPPSEWHRRFRPAAPPLQPILLLFSPYGDRHRVTAQLRRQSSRPSYRPVSAPRPS